MSDGLFITVEGIEGVGKTTQMEFLETLLNEQGKDVIVTREPGGTRTGEAIRELLLHSKDINISDTTELCLMFAARAQHLDEVIRPALASGQIVLCDRFTDATFAYQGGGRGINVDRIRILENLVQDSLRPNLTLLLDAPVKTGLERAHKRSDADRFEQETIEFFDKVRSEYLSIAKAEPDRVMVIDATVSIDAVQKNLRAALESKGLC
jgi:dTMP kinase